MTGSGPGRIYSCRFANRRGGSAAWSYEVPSDKRAIVTWIGLSAFTPAGASVFVFINPNPALYWVSERTNDRAFWSVRLVAYPGDAIGFQTAGSDVCIHATGYLLSDDGTAPTPSPGMVAEQQPAMPALPGLDFEG